MVLRRSALSTHRKKADSLNLDRTLSFSQITGLVCLHLCGSVINCILFHTNQGISDVTESQLLCLDDSYHCLGLEEVYIKEKKVLKSFNGPMGSILLNECLRLHHAFETLPALFVGS